MRWPTRRVWSPTWAVSRAASRRPSTILVSSAGIRWQAASSTGSTAPTRRCSRARCGCSPRPATTADSTFSRVAAVVAELGADVVALPADRHDQVVAVISHVPHLAAATLMGLASDRAEEHAALLRLAAGGFRDMTRIASGHPAIWLDICAENRPAILSALDGLIERSGVDARRRRPRRPRCPVRPPSARSRGPHQPAEQGQPARVSWPRCASPSPTVPGAAAEVFTLAAELGVNIASFEVVHSVEGNRGVAVVLVDVATAELYRGGLMARGYRPAVQRLD